MARKSYLKRAQKSQDMSLQITSMADIFTIILIFLLKSYSVGMFETSLPKGMELPQASVMGADVKGIETALKIEVSQDEISMNGKRIARISNYSFPGSDVGSEGFSRSMLASLQEATEPNAKVLVVADQRAPYETIKTVLASAATRGYTNVKLAVTQND